MAILLLNPYSGRFCFIEKVLLIDLELDISDSFVAPCLYDGKFASDKNGQERQLLCENDRKIYLWLNRL